MIASHLALPRPCLGASRLRRLRPLGLTLLLALGVAASPAVRAQSSGATGGGLPGGWTGLGNTSVNGSTLQMSSGDGAADIGLIGQATGVAVTQFDTELGYAYQGSLLQQQFNATAGQKLGFTWAFSSTETSGDASFADYAFVVLDGQLMRLGGVGTAPAGNSFTQLVLGSSGVHTVSFGVVDLGDTTTPSQLQVGGVTVSAVPEPGSWALMLAGLTLLGWRARRR